MHKATDFLDIQQLKRMRHHSKSNSHKLEKSCTAIQCDNTDLKVSRKEKKTITKLVSVYGQTVSHMYFN